MSTNRIQNEPHDEEEMVNAPTERQLIAASEESKPDLEAENGGANTQRRSIVSRLLTKDDGTSQPLLIEQLLMKENQTLFIG